MSKYFEKVEKKVNQLATEYAVEIELKKGTHEYVNSIRDFKYGFSAGQPIHFGRWLLKVATPTFDTEGFLCWSFNNELKDTDEMYFLFMKISK